MEVKLGFGGFSGRFLFWRYRLDIIFVLTPKLFPPTRGFNHDGAFDARTNVTAFQVRRGTAQIGYVSSLYRGRRIENVVPLPLVLATSIRPFSDVMI